MVDKVERQDGDQHQQSAELGEQEKLYGRVDASLVAPYNDEKIHRDQHQLPGKIEKKQVNRKEHAHDCRQNPHQVEVKKADLLADFRPGGEHGHDAQEKREDEHQQAKAIHRKMKMDAKTRHPIPVQLIEPRPRGARGSAGPNERGQDEIDANRDERDPTRELRAPACGEPGENASDQQNANQIAQDHKKSTMAMNSTDPAAIPMAYQRTRPVSVWLNPR